jgi:hypothetical protein
MPAFWPKNTPSDPFVFDALFLGARFDANFIG